jgi:pimeloyl-ACP methyl ester carboxylesterase
MPNRTASLAAPHRHSLAASRAGVGTGDCGGRTDRHTRPDLLARRAAERGGRSGLAAPKVGPTDIENAAQEGQSVLLICGQSGSSLIWARVLPLLRSRGLRVLAADRPANDHKGRPALGQFGDAAAIARVLDGRQDSPAVIVGHGSGAGIALALAATAPRHVRALVLIAPAAGAGAITATDRLLAAPLVGPTLTWFGFRATGMVLHHRPLRHRVLTGPFGLSATTAREVVRKISHGQVWRSFSAEQRQMVADARRLQDQLRAVRCPVIIVAGTRDRIVRPRFVAALAHGLTQSSISKTDTGHLVPVDDPGAVVKAVLRALRWEYRNSLRSPGATRLTETPRAAMPAVD